MLLAFALTPNQRCVKLLSHKEGVQTSTSLLSRKACGAMLGFSYVLNCPWLWQFSEMEKVVNFCDEEDMSMSSLFLSGSQVSMKLL